MRYVVTGGAGFIGSHLLPSLIAEDSKSEIHVLDHIGPTSNPELLESALLVRSVQLHRFDINDFDRVDHLVAGADVVIHLAAETYVDHSLESPALFVEVNVQGTVNLLRAAQRHKV